MLLTRIISLALLAHFTTCLTTPNLTNFVKSYGYPCETHNIITEDGYILTFHRIPRGLKSKPNPKTPPVILVHGLGSSAADWVSLGPERGLGFILADSGYDVWMANCRGTSFSRKHQSIDVNKNPKKFFNFRWHEIGFYDIPAAIDYIINRTSFNKVQYIGLSQGGTCFVIMTSTRPEYNDKIKLASLMAPAVYQRKHNPFISNALKHIDIIEKDMEELKIYEMPLIEKSRLYVRNNCERKDARGMLCRTIVSVIAGGVDDDQVDKNVYSKMSQFFPSSFSMKQMIHFGQQITEGRFSYYNYGIKKNKEIYGTDGPPLYNLSLVTAPVALYYSKNDDLVGFEALRQSLPNCIRSYIVPYEKFNHIDFTIARDVVKLLYKKLIAFMN